MSLKPLMLQPGQAHGEGCQQQARALLRGLTDLYRAVRAGQAPEGNSTST
jgi:hypothetical protein